jgi:ribosomal protein S17E
MVKIVIDDTEYETEELETNAKAQIASVQFLDVHMQTLRNEIAVYETAKRSYQKALKAEMDKMAPQSEG